MDAVWRSAALLGGTVHCSAARSWACWNILDLRLPLGRQGSPAALASDNGSSRRRLPTANAYTVIPTLFEVPVMDY